MRKWTIIRTALILWLAAAAALRAAAPVYVVLWFDTEDYIEPAADDVTLRIARRGPAMFEAAHTVTHIDEWLTGSSVLTSTRKCNI
jgi:hypothetical protein